MQALEISITTDSGGDGTNTLPHSVKGILHSVQLVDGDFADGVDLDLYDSTPDGDLLLLSIDNFNTDQRIYPRTLIHLDTTGASIAANYDRHFIFGKLKAVIAQGGDTKTGKVIVGIED